MRPYLLAYCKDKGPKRKKGKGVVERVCEFQIVARPSQTESAAVLASPCGHSVWLSPDNIASLERGKQRVACTCHTEAVNNLLKQP